MAGDTGNPVAEHPKDKAVANDVTKLSDEYGLISVLLGWKTAMLTNMIGDFV